MTNCSCKTDCSVLSVVSGITVAIVAAILRYTAIVTVTPAFLWVLFGIAVVFLGLTPGAAALIRSCGSRGCACSALRGILWGTLGTILTSVLLLGIGFVATSVVGAVIFGLLAGFFTLAATSVACLAKCISGCDVIMRD